MDTNNWAFAYLLVNVSSLFDIILTCSGCISSRLFICSVGGKVAKSTNRDACIVVTDIGNNCTKNTCIDSTYAVGI